MFAIERQQSIMKLLAENGKVTIAELVTLFNTSHETIRKDLLYLEQQNALKRIYGGAISMDSYCSMQPLATRKTERVAQKNELCRYAVQLIQEDDVIAIDEGSTAAEFAKMLVGRFKNLTVVTYNLEVFHILSENTDYQLMLCGGRFIREENAFTGHLAVELASQLHTRKAFVCPAAVSLQYGVTDFAEEFIPVQKSFVKNTDKVIVLADSWKFEIASRYKICEMTSDITVVTDSQLTDDILHLYQENHVDIIRDSQ